MFLILKDTDWFEKKAEEYCMRQSLLEDVRDNICKAFEDGAEFGYNKCNTELAKAKKIIRNCLNLRNSVMTEETERALIKEAEQFLNSKEA